MIDTAKLNQITTLAHGSHTPNDGEMCAMEAAAYVAGEPWSDHPQCVSPVIAAFMRSWNDALPDEDRTRLLLPLIPDTVGTRTTDDDEETRAWMATDWLVRVHTSAWLRLAGLTEHAQALESCARLADAATAQLEQPKIDAAARAARAARAASDASAAWVSWAASAAWVSWAASAESAESAASATWDASAAWDVLSPTVAALQVSACELVRAMCAVGRTANTEETDDE